MGGALSVGKLYMVVRVGSSVQIITWWCCRHDGADKSSVFAGKGMPEIMSSCACNPYGRACAVTRVSG